jgi:bifunctional NMN adenylyltransferase/nudix hydrolase
MKKYDAVVFIGRFQPFHNAHFDIIKKAYELTDYVILIAGSQYQPPSYKNPFQALTFDGYFDSIGKTIDNYLRVNFEDYYDEDRNYEFSFCFQRDIYGDNLWCKSVQEKVSELFLGQEAEIAIIGCNKDESSYYLNMFPQWDLIEVPLDQNLSATQIRELYFVEEPNMSFLQGVVSSEVFNYLDEHKNTEWHNNIVNERNFIEKYKAQYASFPYPPTFVTVDSVVFQSGHVLVVRRNAYPGKGLIALPGGFLDANSDASLEDAMIRELREETGLKVPTPVLKGSIKDVKVFDSLYRSSRGRTITHAHNIVLSDGELPRVKGDSDADKAFWLPFSQLKSEQFFEDHYQIINYFL